MFSVKFHEAVERAKEAGACEPDMDRIEQFKSWKEFLKPKAAAFWLCWYAQEVIKGRWLEAEDLIMSDARSAYLYKLYVLKEEQTHG